MPPDLAERAGVATKQNAVHMGASSLSDWPLAFSGIGWILCDAMTCGGRRAAAAGAAIQT